jgi:hydroxymethylglutaryl-CoA lyase
MPFVAPILKRKSASEISLPDHSVEIVEVGPRDGLQSEDVTVDTAVKVGLIERLLAAGIRRVEVASFVNPRKVPQMADAEQVFARLPRQSDVSYVGLVLNRRGFERAVAAGCREIGMVIAASDTFNRRNQGTGTTDSIAAWREMAQEARGAGVRAHVTIATAFGCPFEGEIPMARVTDLACQIAEEAPVEIAFADTIGVAAPHQVTEIVASLHKAVPQIRLRAHFHNTRNMGIANAQAAIDAGITILDASIGGLGGCPFAPGATGNIATEELLYLTERSGIRTGISIGGLIETARWLQAQIGRPLPGLLMKAGLFSGNNPRAT